MKAAWFGWNGPMMNQLGKTLQGIIPFDAFLIGNHDVKKTEMLPGAVIINDKEEFFSFCKEYELIFYDTYEFAHGHRPEVYSFLGSTAVITLPEWKDLPACKVLIDGESLGGQMEWYGKARQFFDLVFTTNPGLWRDAYYPAGVNAEDWYDTDEERDIDILYTGSNISRSYRGEIASKINDVAKELDLKAVIHDDKDAPLKVWRSELRRTKIYIATRSCDSGTLHPMGTKDKDLKAILCGALALTEPLDYADRFFPMKPLFHTIHDLGRQLQYFVDNDEHRIETVNACKQHIHEKLTWEKIWRDFLNDHLPDALPQEGSS